MKKYLLNNFPQQIIAKINNNDYLPNKKDIFNAFEINLKAIKVIIIGQDPYHTPNVANGFAFSSLQKKLPPSLKNIYKEANSINQNGDLSVWHQQGVFLLNRILTVKPHQPLSHKNIGWEDFTNQTIKYLNSNKKIAHVYLLWGKEAQKLAKYITNPLALIIKTSHPSPLSAYISFLGSKQFIITNQYLIKHEIKPIVW